MATIVNITPNDPWAGFGTAFSKSLAQTKQHAQEAAMAEQALKNKQILFQSEIEMKRQAQKEQEAELANLIGAAGTPDQEGTQQELLKQLLAGTGVPSGPEQPSNAYVGPKPAQPAAPGAETFPGIQRPQFMESQQGAQRKLGAKGLLVDPRALDIAITMDQKLKLDAADATKNMSSLKARKDMIDYQKNLLSFKTSSEKQTARDQMVSNGAEIITNNKKLFPNLKGADGEDRSQAAEGLAAYLADTNPTMLLALVSGENTWVKKDALSRDIGDSDLVAPGTTNAIPMGQFTKLWADKQENLPTAIKTHRIQLKEWAVGKWADSGGEFDEKFPNGTPQRSAVNGWYNYMSKLEEHSNDVFKEGATLIQGWNEMDRIDQKRFKVAFEQGMHDAMGIISDGVYDDGVGIVDVDRLATALKQQLLNQMKKDLSVVKKGDREKAIRSTLSDVGIEKAMSAASWDADKSGNTFEMLEASFAGYNIRDKEYIPNLPSWQDALTTSLQGTTADGKKGVEIWTDQKNPRFAKWAKNMIQTYPENAEEIKTVISNPQVLLQMVSPTTR